MQPIAANTVITTSRRYLFDPDAAVMALRPVAPVVPAPAPEQWCSLSSLMRGEFSEPDAGTAVDDPCFPVRRVPSGMELLHEEGAFQNLYFVKGGIFKFVRTDEEGYEQVLGFAVRGDVIGMEGFATGRHAASVIALEDSRVVVVPFAEARRLAARMPAVESFLHQCVSRELRRGLESMQLLAAVGAEARLARFLLLMSQRHALKGQSSRRLVLRMTRRDIASYLGLAHETVSRAFSALAQGGYLNVSLRQVEIVDADGLLGFQRSMRRPGEADRPERATAASTTKRNTRGPRPAAPAVGYAGFACA